MNLNLLPNDVFTSLQLLLEDIATKTQIVTIAVITICLIAAGLMHMLGEGLSIRAKQWIISIIIGGVIVFAASTIAQGIRDVANYF